LRRPRPGDIEAIFTRYASDPSVTRFLGWPRHETIDDTKAFLDFSDREWKRHAAGPYLIEDQSGKLLGGTGLGYEGPELVSTGYVLAQDAWGLGYATESLRAMVDLAAELSVRRLYALCHTDHASSSHVLEKCGFELEGMLERHLVFPNLGSEPLDVLRYTIVPGQA
jgi:ribosomal-protein-alanine N-acetyltransferase